VNLDVSTPGEPAHVGIHPRIVSLLGLAAIIAGLGYAGRAAYYAATDSWVAPVTLSPDSDAVIETNVHLNEQLTKEAKLKSDIARIDADALGVGRAMTRLRVLQQNGQKAFKWAARSTGQQADSSAASLRSLEGQHALLVNMVARQDEAVERMRRNVDAGLASSIDLEREVQASSELRLGLAENERRSADLRVQGAQARRSAGALRAVSEAQPGSADADSGVLPEIASGLERDANVELALIRLESEHRALFNAKDLATDDLARLEETIKQLKSRPLYRAVVASTDIAFVPYSQLEGITPGVELVSCTWAVFRCHAVGRVKEVLPGEIVAQDAWAKSARGQYAILELTDHDAAKEKTLRARPSSR
jgi:hypothetical protein